MNQSLLINSIVILQFENVFHSGHLLDHWCPTFWGGHYPNYHSEVNQFNVKTILWCDDKSDTEKYLNQSFFFESGSLLPTELVS